MLSSFSRVQLFATPWTVACQAPLSMGFSKQEYWSELSCSPPADFPNPEIEPISLTAPALAAGFFTTSATWEVPKLICMQSTKCYQGCSFQCSPPESTSSTSFLCILLGKIYVYANTAQMSEMTAHCPQCSVPCFSHLTIQLVQWSVSPGY